MLLPTYAKPESQKPGISEYHQLYGFMSTQTLVFTALFGRMDGDKHFKCATTQVAPGLKCSWPLHPSVGILFRPPLLN